MKNRYNKDTLKQHIVGLLVAIFVPIAAYSQTVSIIDDLKKPEPNTGATVIVYQDTTITDMLAPKSNGHQPMATLAKGWSVQVFSDNAQKAKDEAFEIENKIKERMPNEYVRAERHAPFWKVRVGQFSTQEEAQTLKEVLIKEFPELKGSIYVVRFNSGN